MSLLQQLGTLGLPMRGSYPAVEVATTDAAGNETTATYQRWIGWTTDGAKADAAREAGATVTSYRAHDPRFNGWEVSVNETVDA